MITRRLFIEFPIIAFAAQVLGSNLKFGKESQITVAPGKTLVVFPCRAIDGHRGYVLREDVKRLISQLVDEAGLAIYTLPRAEAAGIVKDWTKVVAEGISAQLLNSGLVMIDELPSGYTPSVACDASLLAKPFFQGE